METEHGTRDSQSTAALVSDTSDTPDTGDMAKAATMKKLRNALKAIVTLDLKHNADGSDDFYSGADRFFKAHAIARAALQGTCSRI